MRKNLVNVRLMIHHPEIDERVEIRRGFSCHSWCLVSTNSPSVHTEFAADVKESRLHNFFFRSQSASINNSWLLNNKVFHSSIWLRGFLRCELTNPRFRMSLKQNFGYFCLRAEAIKAISSRTSPLCDLGIESSMRKNVLKLVQHCSDQELNSINWNLIKASVFRHCSAESITAEPSCNECV